MLRSFCGNGKNTKQKILIAKSIIKFVKLNLLNFSRQSASSCATDVLNFSSTSRFRVIRVESKIMKKSHKF